MSKVEIAERYELVRDVELIACQQSLAYLCKDKLEFRDIAEFHKDLFQVIADDENKRKLLLLPRGHLKSSVVTIGYSIQQIIKNPDIRILIDNAVWDNSRKFLKSIKEYFLSEKMQEIYPCAFDKDTAEELIINRRINKALKEPTIDTSGVEKTKTSQHYDLIIADDLVCRENVGTSEQLEKVKLHYKDLLDLLEPDGMLVVIGTRWHYSDLYGDILEDESGLWQVLKRAAIVDGKVLFPEKFSLKYLEQLRKEKGNYEFSTQYLNEPVDADTAHFRMSDVRYFEVLPANHTYFCAFDPAFSQRDSADYTAGVVIACDDSKPFNIYVDAYCRERLTPGQVIDKIYEFRDRYQPNAIGLEANATQKVLFDFLYKDPRISGGVPITELKPDADKFRRILKLQPFVENHRVFIRREMRELLDEMIRFPLGEHDDLIDALAYAVKLTWETATPAMPVKYGTADYYERMAEEQREFQKDLERIYGE